MIKWATFVLCLAAAYLFGHLLGYFKVAGQGDVVLFRRALDDAGRSIVVTRGADLEKSIFDFCGKEMGGQILRLYEVRVTIESPKQAPVVLASQVRCEEAYDFDRGVDVLDSLVDKNEIALCLAEGPELYIWRISIPGGNNLLLRGPAAGVWSIRAAPFRIDGRSVTARLEKRGGDLTHRPKLLLEISESRNPSRFTFENDELSDPSAFHLVHKQP